MYMVKVDRPGRRFESDRVIEERLLVNKELPERLIKRGWKKIGHRRAVKGEDYDTIEMFTLKRR